MKYYLAIKKECGIDILDIWMNLENIVLPERSQSQKTTYYVIPLA